MFSTLTTPPRRENLTDRSWKATFGVGGLTAILGALVLIDPGTSLIVVAMLAGAELAVSGMYHLSSKGASESSSDRGLRVAVGFGAVIAGFFFLIHPAVTLLAISVVIGAVWIAQGVIETVSGAATVRRGGTGCPVAAGLISIIAGLVVMIWPVSSLLTLTIVLGLWLIVRGVTRMITAAALRQASPSCNTREASRLR